jgi:hypothetical protein
LIGYGLVFNLGIAAVGGVVIVLAGFAWGFEPADDPEAHAHAHPNGEHGELGDGEHGDGEEPAAVGAGTATDEEGDSDD